MSAELTVADRILAALAKSQKIDVRTIQLQHSLQHDLGLNSADSIDLVFASNTFRLNNRPSSLPAIS